MSRFGSPTVRLGVGAGVLLYAHALLPNSHAYPFIWPLLGGAVALWSAARRADGSLSARDMLRIGAGVGLLAAVVALAAVTPTYALLTTASGGQLARALGAPGPLPWSPRALAAFALVLLLAIPAGLLGSVAARPFVHSRSA